MPRITRTRTLDRPPGDVWGLIADPRALPAWWPNVERVERVTRTEFTMVMRSSRGVLVRADFRREQSEQERTLLWTQKLTGTPFQAVFSKRAIEVALEEAGAGETTVRLTVEQELRGAARFSPQMNRRGTRRQLDRALAALAAAPISR